MLNKLLLGVLFFASFPLLAQTESGNPFFEDEWEAANCPGALPADEPPYESRIEYYARAGDDSKYDEVVAKHYRYSDCVTAITTGGWQPIGAFNSYQRAMKMGDVKSAEELFTLDAALERAAETYDPRGPIYPILIELYEDAYSQEMSDMAEADLDAARELLTREYLCDCLTRPLVEFDIPGYPSNAAD
tara:strand:+ start:1226 stop:1792 length:567 start_codon:yes stop_codon:yes gene_type:complete